VERTDGGVRGHAFRGRHIRRRARRRGHHGKGAKSIIGGGDSVKALNMTGTDGQSDLRQTGGGASLEFLEGRVLPGVAALS